MFHYTVPPEVTRATWEFASFQDHGDCPHRRVRIFLQQGSYPVFRSVPGTKKDAGTAIWPSKLSPGGPWGFRKVLYYVKQLAASLAES